MGLTYANLSLSNPRLPELKNVQVNALADTGSMYLCIPKSLASRLELEEFDERVIKTADGSKRSCPYVGPVEINFAERTGLVGALVLGDEVLLGAIPMEDLDLYVNPVDQKLRVNQI